MVRVLDVELENFDHPPSTTYSVEKLTLLDSLFLSLICVALQFTDKINLNVQGSEYKSKIFIIHIVEGSCIRII